jgi:hypothetical protein
MKSRGYFHARCALVTLSQENERYPSRQIAQRTDLRQLEAEKLVSDAFACVQAALEEMGTMVRVAADEARETSAYEALWRFVTLLIGAYVASLMAFIGVRQRDA